LRQVENLSGKAERSLFMDGEQMGEVARVDHGFLATAVLLVGVSLIFIYHANHTI
jgi:hypothetical protein